MLDVASFYTEIVYSVLGLIIGLSVSAIVFYSVTYSKVTNKNRQLREACLLYQTQLGQLINKNKALEIQLREAREHAEHHHKNERAGQAASKPAGANFDDEKFDQTIRWSEERQKWFDQAERLHAELDQVKQEKRVLENGLKQANERWKQEREQLQQQFDQLKLQQDESEAQPAEAAGEGGRIDSGDLADLEEKLQKHQDAWKRARQLLETELAKQQAEKRALEAELVTQVDQAEREKQALEEEIEQLSERLVRLQLEQEGKQEPQPHSSAVS